MSTYTIHLCHASSEFTLSDKQVATDIWTAMARRPAVVTFTEVAKRRDTLLLACERYGYQLHTGGDSAICVQAIHKVRSAGEVESVPGVPGPAAQGGHGPRPVLWATFRPLGTLEDVTVCTAHYVTRAADTGGQQLAMTADLADTVAAHAGGARLGFWTGDLNTPDRPLDVTPVDKALRRADLTSCWDELGKYPPTHETSTIDVIGSYDPDRRVSCIRARAWPRGNADHRAISAWYRIRPVREARP